MAEIIDSFEGSFIGTVVGYDVATREVDVFIPKLMPGIPEGQKNIETRTNIGNKNLNIKYNRTITTSSSIKVKAEDVDEPLPEIGSKVIIYFLENQLKWGYWTKFNPNNDYNIISSEKYPKVYTLQIGDKEVIVNTLDKVNIQLPEDYTVILDEDNENKIKNIKIIPDNSLENKINELERKIGCDEEKKQYKDINGKEVQYISPATGLFNKIKNLDKEINSLNTLLGKNEVSYEYKEIEKIKFEYGIEYFIFSAGKYNKIDLNAFNTIEAKEEFLKKINEKYKLYSREEVTTNLTGIFARLSTLETVLKNLNGGTL